MEAIQANGVVTGAGAGGTAPHGTAAAATTGTAAAGLNSAAAATSTASITYQSDIASLKVRLGLNDLNISSSFFSCTNPSTLVELANILYKPERARSRTFRIRNGAGEIPKFFEYRPSNPLNG